MKREQRTKGSRAVSRFFIFLTLLIVLSCVDLYAQMPEQKAVAVRISLDEAVELAFKNNLSLETSRMDLALKKRASNLSWNQFIPNVTAAGSLVRNNEAGTITNTIPFGAPTPFPGAVINGITIPSGNLYDQILVTDPIGLPQWNIAGTIQASLNISLVMFENIRRLQIDYEGGLLSYEKAKLQLERDVRKMYHNMLLLQENIALLRMSFANVERQVQMAQANYNAGLAPELTLLQARVARENMRPIIDQAESGLKLSMMQFAMYLGLDFNTQLELIPISSNIDFIPLDVAQMISSAASKKPEIQELRQNILMMQSARRIQTFLLAPSLSLSWNNTSIFAGDPMKDQWFNDMDRWRNSGSFTLSVALRLHSLIPWSTDSQAVRNLTDQIKMANNGLTQMINGTEIEIYNTVLSLERTRVTTEAQAQTVSLAQQAYRLTEQAYRAGLQDYFQVQNAEQSLHQARVQMLEQQFNYLNGLIDLEYAIGVPFGTLSKRSGE